MRRWIWLLILLWLGMALNLSAAAPVVTLMVDTNGVLKAPTNFWVANQSAINSVVTGGGGGVAQTNISYTAVTNEPWIENGQTGADLPALTSTNPVFSALRIFDLSSGFPQPGVLMLLPDGTLNQRTQPPGLDLGLATNLPFAGLSDAAKIAITNAGAGGGITALTATNAAKTTIWTPQRIYNVRDFGASNNAVMVMDCHMTNGVRTLTSALGNFSSADVGKVITIWYGGPTNRNLTTFITNVTSATVCTLSNAPSVNITNSTAAYGWDDTVYIQTVMDYVSTNGGGTIFFPGYSIIAGPIADTGAWDTHHNAQLYFPNMPQTVASQCAAVTFAGPTPIGKANSASVSERQSLFGGGIISTLVYDPATTAPGAVMDCRNFSNPVTWGGAVQVKFNALRVDFLNFGFIVAFDNNLRCLNIEGAIGGHVTESFISCGYDVSAPRYWPVGTNGFAVKLPGNFNNNDNGFHRSVIGSGFYNAMSLAENARIEGSLIMFPQNALVCDNGMSGAAFITSTEIQEATNVFKVGSTACKITGDMALYYHVITNGMKIRDDPGHALFGNVRVYMEGESTVGIPLPDVGGNGMFDYVQTAAGNPYIKHGGPLQLQDSGKGYAVGADVGTNTLTASASKYGAISFPSYSGTDYVPVIAWRAFNANTHMLELGGSLAYNYSSGGVKAPATIIDFALSNDGATAPRHHLRWDGASGVLTPQIPLTLGTGANPMATVTATQVVSSLFTGNGGGLTNLPGGAGVTGMATNQFTTNVVGAEIVGGLGFAGTTNSGPAYYTNSSGWVRIWGDSVLASNRLTGISSFLTNGTLLITNSVSGHSNSLTASSINQRWIGIDSVNGILAVQGASGNPALISWNLASSADWATLDLQQNNSARLVYGGRGLKITGPRDTPVDDMSVFYAETNAYTVNPSAALGGNLRFKQSTKTWRLANGDGAGVQSLAVSNLEAMTITGTNGVIVSSNSWVNQPALAEGQAAFLSSNGVPHVVWKVGGTLTTNNLNAPLALNLIGYVAAANGGVGDIAGTGLVKVNGAGTPATLATPSTDYVIPSDVYDAVRTNDARIIALAGTLYVANFYGTNSTFENLIVTNLYTLLTNKPMVGTDGNGKIVEKWNLSGLTNLGSAGFSWGLKTALNNVTNYYMSFTGAVYQTIHLTNNCLITAATGVPGAAATVKFIAEGANYVVWWPTNYTTISTNLCSLGTTNWSMTVTNGKVGFLSIAAFEGAYPSNFVVTPKIADYP